MATIVAIVYSIFLFIFLVICGLIFRHTVKFSYLSPRFKKVVTIFGVLALIVIIFSVYRLITLFHVDLDSMIPIPGSSSPSGINF